MTITEAFEAFEIDELVSENRSANTISNYQKTRNSLLKSIGQDLHVELLSYVHVIQWKKKMHDDELRSSYVAQLLRHLRIVLTYLRKHGFSTLDPAEIKIPAFKYRQTPWLTIEEVGRFLAVINNPRDKALFACQFSAGARISEILSLDRGSIVNGSAKIWGKGKKKEDDPDTLEFDANALRLLDEYLENRTDDLEPMFITRQNRRPCLQTAIGLANKYAEKAGIKRYDNDGKPRRIATHVLRHSFGTDLILNGADIYKASKQLRHANIDTTKIYIHGADLHKQSDYDKFHTPVPID